MNKETKQRSTNVVKVILEAVESLNRDAGGLDTDLDMQALSGFFVAESILILAEVVDQGLSSIDSAIMELRNTLRERL